jgi:hypothetical protein
MLITIYGIIFEIFRFLGSFLIFIYLFIGKERHRGGMNSHPYGWPGKTHRVGHSALPK